VATVEVKVPDIGDFSDVPVIEVLVEPGQTVQAEDALVTLESDKATMDVPSPSDGVVGDLKVSVGDSVSEGTVIMLLEPSGTGGNGSAPAGDSAPEPEPDPDAAPEADAKDEQVQAPRAEAPAEPSDSQAERDAAPDVHASPAVRRAARERGIDLGAITGTGRNGRITLEDLDSGGAAAEAGESAPAKAPSSAPAPEPEAEDERVELTRIQRISGPRLQQAWQTIPHVTQFDEADITDLEAFRKTINAEQDVKVTMVALMMKAVVASLKAHPVVNSQLDGDGLILKRRYHLGFAADTPNGLLVPVIRDVDRKGLLAVAAELRELSGRAREGKLKGEEMRGATFTISSLGGIGGTAFTPIINPPEVAILGVSKSAQKPVWDGSQFVPRLIVPLSLSYDHRVIDGALAARFTAHLAGVLGDFRRVLL
jgi:pyruvate dehydrogenase E2 component (dihydrolipoamide acetyltransferase)